MTHSAPLAAPPLRRSERVAIVAALLGLSALAWLYLVAMEGMRGAGGLRPWTGADAALMFGMWAVMMVGMMLPSAMPMTLVYARVASKAARDGAVLPPTGMFVLGYLAAWTAFSAGATAAQWGLDRAALLSPMLVAESPRVGAGLLIVAGIYQLTPWKSSCLLHCRNPAYFFATHWRVGPAGALRLGWHHGLYCLGCCWMLMALLFVGGVMNLLWIAAIALFVLAEKVLPVGLAGGRLAGVGMIAVGSALALGLR